MSHKSIARSVLFLVLALAYVSQISTLHLHPALAHPPESQEQEGSEVTVTELPTSPAPARIESSLSLSTASSPSYNWHTFSGSTIAVSQPITDGAHAITRDSSGNLYVAGLSAGSWNGPAGQVPLHNHSAGTNDDIVIMKLNRNGAYQWHTFYGSTDTELGGNGTIKITLNSVGDIFVAATSSAAWNGPMGETPKHGYSGARDIVVLKLDSSGGYVWHTFYGSSTHDYGDGIVTDSSGNIYVTGQSDATWNGPTGQTPKHAHSYGWGTWEIVALKLDSNGGYVWHTFYGSPPPDHTHTDQGLDIDLDSSNNVYVVGGSDKTWNGPAGQLPLHAHSSNDKAFDIVVLKLTSGGDYVWHTFYGSSYDSGVTTPYGDRGLDVAVQGNQVYVAGYSDATWNGPTGQLPIHPHNSSMTFMDIAVLKLDTNGIYQWHTFYGSAGADVAHDVAVDENGSVYLTGYSNGNWQGDGAVDPVYPYSGGYDIPVLKLNSSGVYQWHSFLGSSGTDYGYGIAVDGYKSICVVGSSGDGWNGPGGKPPLTPHSIGTDFDIVVVKFGGFQLNLPLILR